MGPVMARFAFALLVTLRAADAQDVFIPARQLRGSSNASINITEETMAPSAELADTFPDDTTGFDSVGPFLEVPSPEQDANPAPAKKSAEPSGGSSWGGSSWGGSSWTIHPGWRQSSFCRSHHVGMFCFSHHKVHCCNDHGHFVECTTRRESS